MAALVVDLCLIVPLVFLFLHGISALKKIKINEVRMLEAEEFKLYFC